jgi:hypothetical protein
MLRRVVSCPPCRLALALNTQAGLSIRAPESQRLLVESIKYFSGAAMLPKRVGLPRASALHWARSDSVQ